MATGAGYKSKAAFKLHGFATTDLAYPTALGTPTPGTLGAYDQLPYSKESLSADQGWQANSETLNGLAGISESNNISRLPKGNIELVGSYLGLNQLLAACMGFEKVRITGAGEYPTFISRGARTGTVAGTTTAGSTSTTLVDSGANFLTTIVGAHVRLDQTTTNPDLYMDVRRITVRDSATQITVSPAWTNTPPAGEPYRISDVFAHQYELSQNMHREIMSAASGGPITNPWNANARFVRWGVLGIDKGVSVHEWQAVYVESLSFKLDTSGLTITAELIPFWVDFRTSSRNSSSSTWNFSADSDAYVVKSRIRFADCVFTLGAQGTTDNTVALGINSLEFTIKNNLQADLQTTATGLYREEPHRNAKREITGSFTVPRHTANTRLSYFTAGDLLMARLAITGPLIGGSANNALPHFFFRSLKLDKAEAPVPGPQVIEEKYTFRCLQPPSNSGSSSGWPTPTTGAENSELIVTTYDSCPFNFFMGQHQAY